MGREGVSTLRYLSKLSSFSGQIFCYDAKSLTELKIDPALAETCLNQFFGQSLDQLNLSGYDLIIKSPGIPNSLIPTQHHSKLTSPTQIFFDNCPCPIIGITGTKGKSTTSSLIYAILSEMGLDSHLVGNIGTPALDCLNDLQPDSYVVYELSCHQLSGLTKSPHIAVVLGIYPEHLDYYHDFAEYLAAKASITTYQDKDDYVIFDADNPSSTHLASLSKGKMIPVSNNEKTSMHTYTTNLRGTMYFTNMALAYQVANLLGAESDQIALAFSQFQPLPHRLETVGTFHGIEFINDSLATTPNACIAALDSLDERVTTLILGDHNRNLDYHDLAKRILDSQIKNLILFPPVGEEIWQQVVKLDPSSVERFSILTTTSMKEAISFAYQHTPPGTICLLSPAAPSFTNFVDYVDRGNQFKKYAKQLV
jgi:UDP-N-acetylmuramoylalanine--D-glutamate ligase